MQSRTLLLPVVFREVMGFTLVAHVAIYHDMRIKSTTSQWRVCLVACSCGGWLHLNDVFPSHIQDSKETLIRPASVACLFDIGDRAQMFDRKVNFLFASFDVFPR
jgi:hypothetical protein